MELKRGPNDKTEAKLADEETKIRETHIYLTTGTEKVTVEQETKKMVLWSKEAVANKIFESSGRV